LQAEDALANGAAPMPRRADADPLAHHLDEELERLKLHLRETVEQYEASVEELKASNEELQAMNEELRSATEELETSREELQSINEELTTVNHELKSKVDELAHANSDMHNLMDATAIATVFLDRELRITRFTPTAVALFNFISSDLGRPLTDLKTQLQYPELVPDAVRVLDKLVPIEREVGQADGSWYLARLLPYRTAEDRIAGVVLSFIDITERKQADEMRLWLSAVVTASSDAIISFSLDGTMLSWNNGAERIFGHRAVEAIGRPLSILTPLGEHEGDLLTTKIAAGEGVDNHETVCRRKDGTELQVSVTVSPIHDESGRVIAGTAMVRDIGAAKRAEEALRSSEERMRLVIENAREYAIFSTDLERRITIWNTGAQRLLGWSEDEVLGKSADFIFVPEDRSQGAPDREVATALAEGRAADDRMHQRKDGSRFWASGAMMLMRNAGGEAVGFVKILRDQTAARESREALERSQAELLRVLAENEKARAELQANDTAKDRFLAILSHELRNPLASIDSAVTLMLSDGARPTDRNAANAVVQRQARVMKVLLDDLLDVSRLKLGRLELKRATVRLTEVMSYALDTTATLMTEAGHQLTVDLPPFEVELEGDALRLGQVIGNLLTNAIKYTPHGGQVRVRAALEDDRLQISVSDNGVGIEPARIDSMFEMFTQGQIGEEGSHGLGIGLALVRSLVELHGGEIHAASEGPGRGSEFRITLPGARKADVAPPAVAAPPAAAPDRPRKRGLILIADDNEDAGWGIARLLEIAGFETRRVTGGVEAVKEIAKHKPDVGIIDIGMPDLSGHEVARQVRRTEWGKHMVLVAATGWGQESDQREALDAGFDTHMTKPVELRKLSEVVDELLARRRAV